MMQVPTFSSLMNPLIIALRQLGGSGSVGEIYDKVVEIQAIPEEVLAKLHDPEKSNQTEVAYRLAWARTYLRKFGLIENSTRGVWALTPRAQDLETVDSAGVVRSVRALDQGLQKTARRKMAEDAPQDEIPDEEQEWKARLHQILTKGLDPGAFERLTQRILRESGFLSVEVTGRTGDGGVDGKGVVRIHGFMSFHVVFQCKKIQGSVPASAIRDFRGAMVGRADKGLFITTGTFTPAAVKEATRDGAPPIDLVDGDELAEKLKKLKLGIKCEKVERVIVDDQWFKNV
jgi:restriction system protein